MTILDLSFSSHLKLLIDHSSLPKCYTALNDLLTHIKQEMFMLSAEENIKRGVGLQVLVFELLESSNFGVWFIINI